MKKMMMLPVVALALTATSCATIVCGSKQSVSVTSSPANADIIVDGKFEARTPANLSLERKKSHTLVLHLDGYKDYELKLERKFNAWYIGNLAFGGLIGIIVDPITGAMYKLTPDKVHTDLGQTTAYKNGNVQIQVAMIPEGTQLEKIGQLTHL